MALFCAAIRRDSVSLFRFPLLFHVHVFSCLGRFPWRCLSGSMWTFLWSYFRIHVLLLGICSFLKLVCREWGWISCARIHEFYHGLAFSILIFLVLLWVNWWVFPLLNLLRTLLILFLYCLSIRLFRCSLKIVRYLLHPVVGMFSCHLLSLAGKIFFPCFGMSCFICFVLLFVNISLIFLRQ